MNDHLSLIPRSGAPGASPSTLCLACEAPVSAHCLGRKDKLPPVGNFVGAIGRGERHQIMSQFVATDRISGSIVI